MNIEIRTLEAKLEVKRKIAEKYAIRLHFIPGRSKRGQSPGGSARKRQVINQMKRYDKQVEDLEILIAKLKGE